MSRPDAHAHAPGDVRDALLAYLRAHPDGAHRAEMARVVYGDDALPSRRKINKALRILETHGCVARSGDALWCATGKEPPERRPVDPGPVGARLLASLGDRTASVRELSPLIGYGDDRRGQSYTGKHLAWLRARGYTETVRRGVWRATDAGRAAVARARGETRMCRECGRPLPRKKP